MRDRDDKLSRGAGIFYSIVLILQETQGILCNEDLFSSAASVEPRQSGFPNDD